MSLVPEYTQFCTLMHLELLDRSTHYDTIYLLKLRLSYDGRAIRKQLRKHPYWLYIPHSDIKESLMFLMEKGFSNKEIFDNIVILLYPRDVIEKELLKINSMADVESCRDPETGELRRETVLPLTLYSIELPYHFSKEGIWAVRDNNSDGTKISSQNLS